MPKRSMVANKADHHAQKQHAPSSKPGHTPKISVIIPSAPERSFADVAENLRRIKPEDSAVQLIVVKGTWPPIQRNMGIEKATGEFIFLFDDDIRIPAGIIEKVLKKFREHPGISVIGGPNLTPPESGFLAHCFGFAHGSPFTAGKTYARYTPRKENLFAGEDELISCNLAFRAETLKETPFDPAIFPNEENDLLGRMSKKGVRMSYTPDFFVYHRRRNRLGAYLKQVFNWGAGRMRRTLARPETFSPSFFVPLAFAVYLVSLALYRPFWYLVPAGAYVALNLAFSFLTALKGKNPAYFFAMPAVFFLTHLAYGLGLARGILPARGGTPAASSLHKPARAASRHRATAHTNPPARKDMHLIEIILS